MTVSSSKSITFLEIRARGVIFDLYALAAVIDGHIAAGAKVATTTGFVIVVYAAVTEVFTLDVVIIHGTPPQIYLRIDQLDLPSSPNHQLVALQTIQSGGDLQIIQLYDFWPRLAFLSAVPQET